MEEVSNEIIYAWLQDKNNIFCLGYDAKGKWYDKTNLFRKNLLKEQDNRQLRIHSYQKQSTDKTMEKILYANTLSVPDERLCQFTCDQDNACKGFVYENGMRDQRMMRQCYFYGSEYVLGKENCINCTQFIKQG
jgi:hypothetical protein